MRERGIESGGKTARGGVERQSERVRGEEGRERERALSAEEHARVLTSKNPNTTASKQT